MWINDSVIYTPEITTVAKGEPVSGCVVAVGVGSTVRILLEDGSEHNVDPRQCELVVG